MEAKNYFTERDISLLKFINYFGKSYAEVLAEVFFAGGKQICKNRINVLKNKYGLVKFNKTGAMSPQNYITLTASGARFLEDRGVDIKSPHFSLVTLQHNIVEQLSYHALTLAGKNVERCTVSTWGSSHNHTPDLVYQEGEKLVYVEIELTKKSQKKLAEIFQSIEKDGVSVVLYVCENEKAVESYKTYFPRWDKLRFTSIDKMLETAKTEKKIKGEKQ